MQYLKFVVHDMKTSSESKDCLKTVSSAGIPGTETCLRDIPGKNRMVGSYVTPRTGIGNVADVERRLLFFVLLLARYVSREQFKRSPQRFAWL